MPLRAEELTLAQLLGAIEQENLQVLLSREEVVAALQNAYRKRADLLPKIDAVGTQKRSRSVTLNTIPTASRSNRMDALFKGSMPVFDMTKIGDYKLAKIGHKISQEAYEDFLQAILYEAATGYFTHLRNINRMGVIDANIRRDKALLELAQIQLNAGVATAIDVTRAEGRLALDQRTRLQQETVVTESALLLKVLLAMDPADALSLDKNAYEAAAEDQFQGVSLDTILDQRHDYRRARYEFDESALDYRKAWWAYLPVLDADAQWGYASKKPYDNPKKDQWSMGVTLTIPLFDGFGRGADRLKTFARKRAQEYAKENLKNEIGAEYALALQDIDSRFKQIPLARKQVSLANEELELARNRFEQGLTGNQEVIDAQATLSEALDDLVDIVYEYNLSRLQLARVTGEVRRILD